MTQPDPQPWLYPLARGQKLATNDWVEWHFHSFLASDFLTRIKFAGRRDVGLVAVELWSRSYLEDPAGTLPDDDVLLADRAGFGTDVAAWRKVRDLALYGWEPVMVETEGLPLAGRLGHRVIAGIAVESFRRKDGRKQAREASRLAGVKHKVKGQLMAMGRKRLAEDAHLAEAVARHLMAAGLWATAENVAAALEALHGIPNVIRFPAGEKGAGMAD